MTAFYVPLALFLAAVFAVSAIGKLQSSDHGRAGFDALRISVPNPNAAAAALITVETLIAVALVVTTGWFFVAACAAALALTIALLAVVVRAHRLGARDDCGCFGDWLPAAIGPKLITRNAVLVAIAASILLISVFAMTMLGTPIGVPHAFAAGPGSIAMLGAIIALLFIATATWSTARASVDHAVVAAPPIHGGGAVVVPATAQVVDLLGPGTRARLLVFVSPGCRTCASVLARLGEVEAQVAAMADVYVVQKAIQGKIDAAHDHAVPSQAQYALDVGGSLGAALDVGIARPVVALICSEGNLTGPLASGSDQAILLIDSLIELTEVPPV